MSYIYIVRHGQSLGNLKGGFAGHTDYPLSELGEKQARMTADYLLKTHIDRVISSPLSRTRSTAAPIAADRGLPVEICDGLIEMNFGEWEGRSLEEVGEKYPGAITGWKTEMHKTVCPGGESTVECYERAARTLRHLAEEHRNEDICLVSHGAWIKALLCYLHGVDISLIHTIIWVDNASVTTLEYNDGRFKIIEEGHSAHMGEFVTGVSKAMRQYKESQ